jgi:hypothetical protein
MSNFLNNNPFVELSAMETALGMPPSPLPAPAIAKQKKARRGPSVGLLRGRLESSERMVKLLQEEIAVLRQHMTVGNQVLADQKLYERRKHP